MSDATDFIPNEAKIDIEKNIGRKIAHFCYPAGSYTDEVINKLIDCRYESAVTCLHGFNDENSDLYQLRRIGVSESFLLFKACVSGNYSMLRRIKAIMV